MKLIYIISKYRDKTPWAVEQNVRRAEEIAHTIAEAGHVPICTQAMYRFFDGTMTDKYWLDATAEILYRCDAAFLGNLQDSDGCENEMEICEDHGIPIISSVAELERLK